MKPPMIGDTPGRGWLFHSRNAAYILETIQCKDFVENRLRSLRLLEPLITEKHLPTTYEKYPTEVGFMSQFAGMQKTDRSLYCITLFVEIGMLYK